MKGRRSGSRGTMKCGNYQLGGGGYLAWGPTHTHWLHSTTGLRNHRFIMEFRVILIFGILYFTKGDDEFGKLPLKRTTEEIETSSHKISEHHTSDLLKWQTAHRNVKENKSKGRQNKNIDESVWWPWKSYGEWRKSHRHTGPLRSDQKHEGSNKHKNNKDMNRRRNSRLKETQKRKKKHSRNRSKKKMEKRINAKENDSFGRNKIEKSTATKDKDNAESSNNLHDKPNSNLHKMFSLERSSTEKFITSSAAPHRYEVDNRVNPFNEKMPSLKMKYARATKRNFTADHNECLINNGGCEGLCINTPGSYRCHCPEGFRLDPFHKNCTDINECLVRNGHGPCQGECYNEWGTFRCGCHSIPGTELAEDGHSCKVVDACQKEECSHLCINTRSGAFCACPQGFMLASDWKTCADVDECTQIDLQEPVCKGGCTNTEGSYICL